MELTIDVTMPLGLEKMREYKLYTSLLITSRLGMGGGVSVLYSMDISIDESDNKDQSINQSK